MRIILIALLALPLVAQKDRDDDDRKAISPTAIEAGRRLFLEACSACHGQNGGGGHGPSLVEGHQVRQLNDAQLFQSIQKGIPGTDMPPSPLPEPQIRQVLAFVRSLSAPAINTNVPGNAAAGREVFFGKGGCSGCHAIGGRGGFTGPDLTDAGASRTAGQLRESLLEPNKRIAEGFEAVDVTTRDGQRIHGVAKNHDNYSVQILDESGKLHLLARADIAKIEFGTRSLMPDDFAKRLSASEIQDVLAFLSRQSVRERQKK
jgi:putative heme-binding domain-containing protein